MDEHLYADMDVTIEAVEYCNQENSYLIVKFKDGNFTRVAVGEKAEELARKIKVFLYEVFREEA